MIYAAKSTEDRHGSVPTQLADCRAMADSEGWCVVDEYRDEGFSAYHGNRGPGLVAAREQAARVAADQGSCVLVAQHSDRFARGAGDAPGAAEHLGEVMFWARRHRVQLRSVQDDQSFTNPLLAFVMGERNAEDSRRKALAVKAGMGRRRANGMHMGGPRKIGYDYVRDAYGRTVPDEPLRVVPAEALIVARIFRDYVAGNTQQSIQRALNAEGVRTVNGRTWHQGTIARILADPFYAGVLREGDNVVPGRHEAIVELALWQEAERIREEGRRTLGRRGGRPPTRDYMFTHGHLRCGRCGDAMVARTSQRKGPDGRAWGKPYEAYRCLTRIRNKDNCDQTPLPRADVDEIALLCLQERVISIDRTREQVSEAMEIERRSVVVRLDDVRREEQKAAQAVDRIDRDYTAGALSVASYERLGPRLASELAAAHAQREQIERRMAELEATAPEIDEIVAERFGDLRSAIAEHLRTGRNIDEIRFLLRRYFESFVVRDDEGGRAIVANLRPDVVDDVMADLAGAKREALRGLTTAHNSLQT